MTTPASILVIEDDTSVSATIRDQLEANGYVVRSEATLTKGIYTLHATRPDLLILDIQLPDGHGLDLLRDLRAGDDYFRSLPIIAFTALGSSPQISKGFELGANAYIPKPFDPQRLMDAIEHLLRETATRSDPLTPQQEEPQ